MTKTDKPPVEQPDTLPEIDVPEQEAFPLAEKERKPSVKSLDEFCQEWGKNLLGSKAGREFGVHLARELKLAGINTLAELAAAGPKGIRRPLQAALVADAHGLIAAAALEVKYEKA